MAEWFADLVERLAVGPLQRPVQLVHGLMEGRDPIKLARVAVLTAFCWPALWSQQAWAAQVNKQLMVWFHEGGHGVFMPLSGWHPVGTWLIAAGGSLVQVLVPVMFLVAIYFSGKRFDAMLCWLWVGLNLVDVSIYAADARDRALPLIFNMDKSGHDWWYMLTTTHMLWATELIAGTLWLMGLACFGLAAAGGLWFSGAEEA